MPKLTYNTPEWAYHSLQVIFRSILRVTYNVKSYRLENLNEIQENQGFIVASNHGSIVDAFVMALEIPKHRVRFVGRQRTLWANPLFGKLNDIVGTIPVPERRVKDKSLVIRVSVDAIKQGACVGIFPEGAIMKSRKAFEGKTGTVRIALEANAPIVPIGLINTNGLWPYGAKMPRLGRPVRMWVGKPLWFKEYAYQHNDREVVRYVTDVLMREIRRLSGWYNVPNEKIRELYPHYENLSPP